MSPPPPPPTSFSLHNLGLGYAIAISFGLLVLLSTLLLSSYLCFRTRRRPLPHAPPLSSDGGIIVPRIIFVAEDDDPDNLSATQNGVVGLDRHVINSYPKFQFFKTTIQHNNDLGSGDDNNDSNNLTCSICLCDYKEMEMLRMMPDCKHYFHLSCLDAWLKLNGSCPVCRSSPLPTPISTPLAEVVPLSLYPDNRRRSSVISSSSSS